MSRVLTYGTFDLLYIGHFNLLERLRALGDELILGEGISTSFICETIVERSGFVSIEHPNT
jgi:glycerol-3-phosphate cytidylyltransferase-like family protein